MLFWLPVLAVLPAQTADLPREIEAALAMAEMREFDRAEEELRKLPPDAPLAPWAKAQIRLIHTRFMAASRAKIDRFSELMAEFRSLGGAGDYCEESVAQCLEAQARTQVALGQINDALASLQQSEAKYSALARKSCPESQSVRVRHGYLYVVALSISLRSPGLTALRTRAQAVQRAATELMFFDRHPQAVDGVLYASDVWRSFALKLQAELRSAESEGARETFQNEIDGAWQMARSWARNCRSTLALANGQARELQFKATCREIEAALGWAEWLKSDGRPIGAAASAASALVEEASALVTGSPEIMIQLARLALLQGDVPKGIQILAEVPRWTEDLRFKRKAREMLMELRPPGAEHRSLIARELQADGQYVQAIQFHQKTLAANPGAELEAETWYRIGECYLQMARLIEAVQAYSFFFKPPGSESGPARSACLTSYKALKRLQKAAPLPAQEARIAEMRRFLEERGWLGEYDVRKSAIDKEEEGQFLEAAGRWKKLLDTSMRTEALSRIGFCLAQASSKLEGAEKEAARKEALAHLDLHVKDPAADPRDLIVSIYYSALLRSEENPRKAAEELERFVRGPIELETWAQVKLARKSLDLYLRASDLRSAHELLKFVEDRVEDAAEYARALHLMSRGYSRESARIEDARTSGEYFEASVKYMAQALSADASVVPFQDAWELSEQAYRRATIKGGKDATIYSRARGLLESIRANYPNEMKAAQKDGATLETLVDWQIGLCYLHESNFDSALECIERVERRYRTEQLDVTEAKGDCLAGKAQTAEGRHREDLIRRAQSCYFRVQKKYEKLLDENYFRALHKHLEATLLESPYRLRVLIDLYREKGLKDWDKNQWGYKSKIRDLERRLAEKDPKFQRLPE